MSKMSGHLQKLVDKSGAKMVKQRVFGWKLSDGALYSGDLMTLLEYNIPEYREAVNIIDRLRDQSQQVHTAEATGS